MDGVHILFCQQVYGSSYSSLNPCCNGWCTHTGRRYVQRVKAYLVLILVVMDGVHILYTISC